MRARARSGGAATARWALAAALLATLVLVSIGGFGAGSASGERTQHGNLIVSFDGGLAPLTLPRDRPAPVAVRFDGGLRTDDNELLPRVTTIELALPGQGVITTRGLPTCRQKQLRHATTAAAKAACGSALVGHGRLDADILVPNQPPFAIHASLLAFNGRVGGRTAVILHAFAPDPPTVVVVPFLVHHGSGSSATSLVADLPPSLGPWPHFAHFEITLSRHFTYRGRPRSYLSASCPVPPRFTAGFFSARSTYTLLGGRKVGASIVRGCRAR